jgi:hypothetical protein
MYTWRNWRDVKAVRELENIREATNYAIQSQYAASEKILALAAAFQDRIDPEADVELFYRKMFDIYTAEGMGLDNWGVILGIGRAIPGPYQGPCFGFEVTFDRSSVANMSPEASSGDAPSSLYGSLTLASSFLPGGCAPRAPQVRAGQSPAASLTSKEFQPFDQYPFAPDSGAPPGVTMITLDDELYRLLLLYKALANISASDAATQNKLLSVLMDAVGLCPARTGGYGGGNPPGTGIGTGVGAFSDAAYVLEIDTMAIRWVFESFLTPLQLAVFKVAGTLARGAGVGWELYAVNPSQTFGFDGSGMQPFNQAPFAGDKSLIINRS